MLFWPGVSPAFFSSGTLSQLVFLELNSNLENRFVITWASIGKPKVLKMGMEFFSSYRKLPSDFFCMCAWDKIMYCTSARYIIYPLRPLTHFRLAIMYQSSTSPTQAYPRHLMPFPAWDGENLITTHRGWGI